MAKHNLENRAVVQFFAKQGWQVTAIAHAVGVSRKFVYRWKDREDASRRPGSGRPTKLNKKTLDSIRRKLTRTGGASQRTVARETGLSHPSIGRAAKMLGLKPYRRRKVPALTSEQQ